MTLLGNSTKHKIDLILTLLKLFQKIEEEETLQKSSYEANITLIPKLAKDTTTKENCRPTYLNIYAKILNRYYQTESNHKLKKRSYTITKLAPPQDHKNGSIYAN